MALLRPTFDQLLRPESGSTLIELTPAMSTQGGLVPTDVNGLLSGAATYGLGGWSVPIVGSGVATGVVPASCFWSFDLAQLGYLLGARTSQRLRLLWSYTAAAPTTVAATDRLYVGVGYFDDSGKAAGTATWAYGATLGQMRAQNAAASALVTPSINLAAGPDRLVGLHTWNQPADIGQTVGTARATDLSLSSANSVITDSTAVVGAETAYLSFGMGSASVLGGTFQGRLYASIDNRFGL